jgi:hypothetical protein
MVFLTSGRYCDLLVHPVGNIPYVPDYRARTQLNLLGEGSVAYAGIDEGLSHTRHLNDLRQEEEVRGSTKKKYAGWSFVQRPT